MFIQFLKKKETIVADFPRTPLKKIIEVNTSPSYKALIWLSEPFVTTVLVRI